MILADVFDIVVSTAILAVAIGIGLIAAAVIDSSMRWAGWKDETNGRLDAIEERLKWIQEDLNDRR